MSAIMDVDGSSTRGRWWDIERLLLKGGPLAPSEFEPSRELVDFMREDLRVLVVGAGGLGCELLKDLALMGFGNIDVIDMDTIDASNLNRQFLFRPKDVGQPKATTAANFVNGRVSTAKVTPHYCKIQDKDSEFYRQFQMVVCGLDSIDARRWLNSMLCSLVEFDDDGNIQEETSIVFIDGGTEGFKGQARVMKPMISCCFECTLGMFPPQVNFPLCTIASTPRQPEHCIEWAKLLEWPKHFPDREPDCDNPADVEWLYNHSLARAAVFGIQGVTMRLTLGVAKRIIPAIASTNAVVSAACANEAFKAASACARQLDNYMMFTGLSGVYTYTFQHEKDPNCMVCSRKPVKAQCDAEDTLENFLARIAEAPHLQLKSPVIRFDNKTLYTATADKMGETMIQLVAKNLPMTLSQLGLAYGCTLDVSDKSMVNPIRMVLAKL